MPGPAGTGFGGAMWWHADENHEQEQALDRALAAGPAPEGDGPGPETELVITLGGDIDENASFVELAPRLRGHVVFDLSAVRRINSCGVREWVTFHRDLVPASVTSLEFRACSPQVVAQLNSIANFRGRASVRSFMAPFVCEGCGFEDERLVEVAESPMDTHLPEVRCPTCGLAMEFDDLAERYLSFLREE
jgi:predicted Zn-ribbon and HTH transcriptional regulator